MKLHGKVEEGTGNLTNNNIIHSDNQQPRTQKSRNVCNVCKSQMFYTHSIASQKIINVNSLIKIFGEKNLFSKFFFKLAHSYTN